tara:strand:- start:476 stop:883 length:408 start_codon:yes stop_codon:yes gene_type:complete
LRAVDSSVGTDPYTSKKLRKGRADTPGLFWCTMKNKRKKSKKGKKNKGGQSNHSDSHNAESMHYQDRQEGSGDEGGSSGQEIEDDVAELAHSLAPLGAEQQEIVLQRMRRAGEMATQRLSFECEEESRMGKTNHI